MMNRDKRAFANFKELMDWLEEYATPEQCEKITQAVNRHRAYAGFYEAVIDCIVSHTVSGPGVPYIKAKASEII